MISAILFPILISATNAAPDAANAMELPKYVGDDLKKAADLLYEKSDQQMNFVNGNAGNLIAELEGMVAPVAQRLTAAKTINTQLQSAQADRTKVAEELAKKMKESLAEQARAIGVERIDQEALSSETNAVVGAAKENLMDKTRTLSLTGDSLQEVWDESSKEADYNTVVVEKNAGRIAQEYDREGKRVGAMLEEEGDEGKRFYERDAPQADNLERVSEKFKRRVEASKSQIQRSAEKMQSELDGQIDKRQKVPARFNQQKLDERSKMKIKIKSALAKVEKKHAKQWSDLKKVTKRMKGDLIESAERSTDAFDDSVARSKKNFDQIVGEVEDKDEVTKNEVTEGSESLNDVKAAFKEDTKEFDDGVEKTDKAAADAAEDSMNNEEAVLGAVVKTAKDKLTTVIFGKEQYALSSLTAAKGNVDTEIGSVEGAGNFLLTKMHSEENQAADMVADWTKKKATFEIELNALADMASKTSTNVTTNMNIQIARMLQSGDELKEELEKLQQKAADKMHPMAEYPTTLSELTTNEITKYEQQLQALGDLLKSREDGLDNEYAQKLGETTTHEEAMNEATRLTMNQARTTAVDATSLANQKVPALFIQVGAKSRELASVVETLDGHVAQAVNDLVHTAQVGTNENTVELSKEAQELTESLSKEARTSGITLLHQGSAIREKAKEESHVLQGKGKDMVHEATIIQDEAGSQLHQVQDMGESMVKKISSASAKKQLRVGSVGLYKSKFDRETAGAVEDAKAKLHDLEEKTLAAITGPANNLRATEEARQDQIIDSIETQSQTTRDDLSGVISSLEDSMTKSETGLTELVAKVKGVAANEQGWANNLVEGIAGDTAQASRLAIANAATSAEQQAHVDEKFKKMSALVQQDVHNLDARKQQAMQKMVDAAKKGTQRILANRQLSDEDVQARLAKIDTWLGASIPDTQDKEKSAASSLTASTESSIEFVKKTEERLHSLELMLDHEDTLAGIATDRSDEASAGVGIEQLIDEAKDSTSALKKTIDSDMFNQGQEHIRTGTQLREQMKADGEVLDNVLKDAELDQKDAESSADEKVKEHSDTMTWAEDSMTKAINRFSLGGAVQLKQIDAMPKARSEQLLEVDRDVRMMRSDLQSIMGSVMDTVLASLNGVDAFYAKQLANGEAYSQNFEALMANEHMRMLQKVGQADKDASSIMHDDVKRWEDIGSWTDSNKKWQADVKNGFEDLQAAMVDDLSEAQDKEKGFNQQLGADGKTMLTAEEQRIEDALAASNGAIGQAGAAQAASIAKAKELAALGADGAAGELAGLKGQLNGGVGSAMGPLADTTANKDAALFKFGTLKKIQATNAAKEHEIVAAKNEALENSKKGVLDKLKSLTSLLQTAPKPEPTKEEIALTLGRNAALAAKHNELEDRLHTLRATAL